jgi:putative transposase
VSYWSQRTEIAVVTFMTWLGISRSKLYEWRRRKGLDNRHNHALPRDFWLQPWERAAIIAFYVGHPLEGYRRLAYMMLDANVVAVSPSSVYRVLKEANLLARWNRKPSKKGTGFHQPSGPHRHWHIDVTYINIRGTFYYLCAILDGYSRYLVHWELREKMTTSDVEIVIQRAREKFPEAHPRIISDNGPQFISREFKEFVRLCGMTHVKTSPYYPQSNGKLERWNGTLKCESIRPQTPLSLDDARRIVEAFVHEYNDVRLHSAIQYVTPRDKLEGRSEQILAVRRARLSLAQEEREAAWRRKEVFDQRAEHEPLTAGGPFGILHASGETQASSAGKQLADG